MPITIKQLICIIACAMPLHACDRPADSSTAPAKNNTQSPQSQVDQPQQPQSPVKQNVTPPKPLTPTDKIVAGAIQQVGVTTKYDPAYVGLDYPMGDVPADRGVCTDVVIRALRHTGVDLQQRVHEDMSANFSAYPQNWKLKKPDKNIDHRRVPNLMTFFKRNGKQLPITQNAADYQPGDIVCWRLSNGLPHTGIVIDQTSPDKKRHLVTHNIGRSAFIEDVLFSFTIIGHYRYFP